MLDSGLGDLRRLGYVWSLDGRLTVAPFGTLELADSGAHVGSLTLANISRFVVFVESNAHHPLTVSGALSLGNTQLNVLEIPYLTPDGTVFKLVAGSSPVTGTFSGIQEGGRVSPTEKISYRGGSGNDVTLTIVPPPRVTHTSLTATPADVLHAYQPVTLNASVIGDDGAPAAGTIEFYEGRFSSARGHTQVAPCR